MKFTLSWLKDHLDTAASLEDIVLGLTRVGLEVEGVDNPANRLAPFRVAKILEAAPHPQADKLQVLKVDTGAGEPLQVVCGAPNARAGLYGVFAAPGTYVPGIDVTLKVAAIRGVESHGMMCSERELELSDAHTGIIDLSGEPVVGTPFAEVLGLNDPVIEVSVTPNRQDCMGVRGIARDLAALGLGTLKPGTVESVEGGYDCPVEIRTDDPEGCPAFFGRVVRGVKNGPSPAWLQRRLTAIGLRPISALVDITNYITFDRGRPLHVYDLARLSGAVVARRAAEGESVVALNGKTYALTPEMTVIADAREVHDIAGIMGGEHSGVETETTDILIECAYFDPQRIGRTGRALGLTSDARARFERGVDPAFLEGGLQLATRMVLDLCGGDPSRELRAGRPPEIAPQVDYTPDLTERLTGVTVDPAKQADILAALGFAVETGDTWRITAPSWRRDVDGAADIVEEVVRISGFDAIPSTPLPRAEGVAKPTATPAQLTERTLRRAAAARGLDEAVTWSFIAPQDAESFGGGVFTLENPISADLAVMRPSLLPGLIAAAQRNSDRGATSIRLFELGRRYLGEGERLTLGLVLAGARQEKDWREGGTKGFDVFDAKAEVLTLLAAAGAPVDRVQAFTGASPWYHPGRSAKLGLGPKTILAEFGELHPRLARAFDLQGRVAVAEIFLDAIPAPRGKRGRAVYSPPALQAVTRDFAFVADKALAADVLLRAVQKAEPKRIAAVRLFDLFEGVGIEPGKRSLAVHVTLQPNERSFTEEEISAIAGKIVASARAVGAELRE
ncbi:phenylalanine--tRNA ligase subunit beta [Sphingosinicella xenopeptidilytica]|uniref:Phenylalanine--tRNA ligase beta subunit n=1 Tax=Sphingosinicella xenopeptidilytica TaxID=364098 RepID=A0ABW3C683_SPHXN